jgi:hypothetical protein
MKLIWIFKNMRGIPDFRVALTKEKPEITGGDGGGEKVYAIGHQAAINFVGVLSTKGGERFYGILLPKGFVERYGLDLSTAGIGGKSARTPTDQDFANGFMFDDQGKKHKILIPEEKRGFAIRAEDATPHG